MLPIWLTRFMFRWLEWSGTSNFTCNPSTSSVSLQWPHFLY